MRIRTRLTGLLIVLTLIFLAVFLIQKHYDRRRLIELMDSVKEERENVFDKILLLQQKPLQTWAFDYSFWGEMVDFVTAPSKKWAADNLDVGLDTFQSNALWIYNMDKQLVYSVNNLEDEVGLKEIPVPRQALGSLFKKTPFCHFFINTAKGLMEVFGASIHAGEDIKREGASYGYLFCARLWTQVYIDELAQLTNSTVELSDAENKSNSPGGKEVNFSRVLTGWDNLPVKYANVSTSSRGITNLKKSAIQTATLFIGFSVVVLLVILIFIFYWINLPLKLITGSLKRGDATFLKEIKKQSTEFGDIARMMDAFFSQRKIVLEEVDQRRRIQDALNKVNNCFVSFGANIDQNIRLITETAGEILGATYTLYNRSFDGKLVVESSWNVPLDFVKSDLGQGHICFELIKSQGKDQLEIIEGLQHSGYAQTDPNVKKFNLQTYIGCPIIVKDSIVAMLCAVFTSAVKIDQYHLNLLQVLGKAAAVEEERKHTQGLLAAQALKLDQALKEALKSREVLLSMLEDNQLGKIRLEQNVKELDSAYSKLQESQEEVVQSARFGAIGQLSSSVAHEVRNPLAIIMQSLQFLENKIPAQHREIIQIAINSVKRANTIIGTLLDFSKAKKVSMGPEDINPLINDALALTRYSDAQDKVVLIRELGDNLPKVLVDRQKIEQVLVNLFLNAMQAMPEGGTLWVRTYLDKIDQLTKKAKNEIQSQVLSTKNVVILEIKDSGVGISQKNMENIFRPFFTTKGAMTGIGLGLSVVKDIITLHNGHIAIESQENVGTKVTIILRTA